MMFTEKGRGKLLAWLSWDICFSHSEEPRKLHKTTTALNHNEDALICLLLT